MTFTDVVEKHKFFRRLALVWAMCVITWVIYRVFGNNPPEIKGDTTAALAIVVGLLATVIGFYKWSRNKDDGNG